MKHSTGITRAAWAVTTILSIAWFAGMFVFHSTLWIPWLCLFVALALLTALLLSEHPS